MTAAAIASDLDEYLWGDGFYEQGRAYYPPLPKPIQHRVECAKCGDLVPPDDHVAYDGLPYHNRCLPEEAKAAVRAQLEEIEEQKVEDFRVLFKTRKEAMG